MLKAGWLMTDFRVNVYTNYLHLNIVEEYVTGQACQCTRSDVYTNDLLVDNFSIRVKDFFDQPRADTVSKG